MRTRIAAGAAVVTLAVVLAGCLPAGHSAPVIEGDPIDVDFTILGDGDLAAIPAASWGSGVLSAFDDVAEMLPDIAPYREELAGDDAAFGQTVMTTLSIPPSVQTTAPRGGRLSRGAAAISEGQALGDVLVGGLAPGAIKGAMDQAEAGAFGGEDSTTENGVTVTRDAEGDVSITISNEASASGGDGTGAATKFTVSYDGTWCPAADGAFDVIVQAQRAASGRGAAGSADLAQSVRVELTGVLGEEAFPTQLDVVTSQRTTRTDANGAVTAATTAQATDWFGGPGLDPKKNPPRKVEESAGADADVAKLAAEGQEHAAAIAFGLIANLYSFWTDGGCVKIDTDAPTQVDPESTTDFTIRVLRKLTGAEVTGPLNLTLAGEHDVDPKESVSTGGFHYTAGKKGETGELTIVATSRQGGAQLVHTFTTSAAYRITGGWGGHLIDQVVCDAAAFAQPVLGFPFDGGGYTFAPGQFSMAYSAGSDVQDLHGTWTMQTDPDGIPTGIVAQASGEQASGVGTTTPTGSLIGPQTITFTITPAEEGAEC